MLLRGGRDLQRPLVRACQGIISAAAGEQGAASAVSRAHADLHPGTIMNRYSCTPRYLEQAAKVKQPSVFEASR